MTRYCWRCEVFQQRSVGSSVKECCGGRLSVRMDFGLCVAWQNLLWYVSRWLAGGKISISGRTGLDLGLVYAVCLGIKAQVCCVVLYYSLLALFRRGCWSEDRNLSFCARKGEFGFSAISDDVERGCVRTRTALLSGETDWLLSRLFSVLLFVLGRSFRLE